MRQHKYTHADRQALARETRQLALDYNPPLDLCEEMNTTISMSREDTFRKIDEVVAQLDIPFIYNAGGTLEDE